VQSIENLRKRWDEQARLVPFRSVIEITDEGLVFGAGTVLARMTQDALGVPSLAVDADEERILLCSSRLTAGRFRGVRSNISPAPPTNGGAVTNASPI
jgi:hypothetical protein